MASAINWVNPTTGEVTVNKQAAKVADPLTSKTTFLSLLVAQLKNQDPLNPQDGAAFVTQLAQFTQLEQSMSLSTDLSAIRAVVAPDKSSTSTDTSNDTSKDSSKDSGSKDQTKTGQA